MLEAPLPKKAWTAIHPTFQCQDSESETFSARLVQQVGGSWLAGRGRNAKLERVVGVSQ